MTAKNTRLWGASLFALLASAVLAGPEERLEWRFTLGAGGNVSVNNVNGAIRVTAWDQDEVEIIAVKKAKGGLFGSGEDYLDQVRIEIEESEDGVSVRTAYPSGWRNKGKVSVYYELRVPLETNLELDTTNGKILAAGVTGDVAAETTNGRIELEEVSGSIRANTTNGSIRAELLSHNGQDLRFNTTNGSISLAVPEDIKAQVKAGVTNGSIDTDLPITLRGKMSRRSINGEVNGGGALIRLSTTNGSIRIKSI